MFGAPLWSHHVTYFSRIALEQPTATPPDVKVLKLGESSISPRVVNAFLGSRTLPLALEVRDMLRVGYGCSCAVLGRFAETNSIATVAGFVLV